MAKKKNNDSQTGNGMDKDAMLKAFIEKYGMGAIMEDVVGEVDPEMTFAEFCSMVEDRGVMDSVQDMKLGELFNMKPKTTPQKVLKEKILEVLDNNPGLTVGGIGEELGEKGKHVSVAMAALKKAGKVVGEGDKKSMTYTLAE